MSTDMMTYDKVAGNSEITAPQQAMEVSESSRTLAEVQAAITVAQARPRNQVQAVDRIMTSCQRLRLAEGSQYSYAKGGQTITGPSVRLLETIAQNWGNIQFGFREISQRNGESTVEAFAWDMETNTKEVRQFVVPHRMKTGRGMKHLDDPRDIYEYIANQAQRRVRSCLENVIPRDIVEDAVDQCNDTLKAKADTSPEAVKKMVDAFKNQFGVTKEQIEKRIQRNVTSVQPAQIISLRRIYNSLKDGMSEVGDWFEAIEDKPAADIKKTDKKPTVKDKLKGDDKKPKQQETENPEAAADKDLEPQSQPADEAEQVTKETLSERGLSYFDDMIKKSTIGKLSAMRSSIEADEELSDGDRSFLLNEANDMIGVLEDEAKEAQES